MTYVLGSTERVKLASTGLAARVMNTRQISYGPGGHCHAVAAGSETAVCGATGLIVWPDRPWERGLSFHGFERCPECVALVPVAAL